LAAPQRIRRIDLTELPKSISGEVRRIDMAISENACQPGISAGEYRDGGIHWYQ
jgi:hypothetical protein